MNTVSYFKNNEKQSIGDCYEGIDHCFQPKDIQLIVNGRRITQILSPVTLEDGGNKYTHIFSCFCIYEGLPMREDLKIADDKVSDFGNSFCLMRPRAFLEKINEALSKNENINSYSCDLVEYVNSESYKGEMGIFKKFDSYSWQQEYRIAIQAKKDKDIPFLLKIGSLEGVACIVKISDFINRVHIENNKQNLIFS